MRHQKQEVVANIESSSFQCSLEYSANTPLWQRVPTRDTSGEYLGDFMVIFPSLKTASAIQRKDVINKITQVLSHYADTVVFADLNMKIGLLWVSIKPVKGMIVEIPMALIDAIPTAKLVSERPTR